MSWLESIFYRGKTRQERQVEAIMETVRKEAEKEGISDPLFGVSEPIISFVETVRNNPKRFRIIEKIYNDFGFFHFFKDKHTKEMWEFTIEERLAAGALQFSKQLRFPSVKDQWITMEEREYLLKEIGDILTEEYKRKREQVESKQRKHYMKIYYKGE